MKARVQAKGLPASRAQDASRLVRGPRKGSVQGGAPPCGSAAHPPSPAAASLDATKDHYHRVLAEFSSPAPLRVRVNAKKPLVWLSLARVLHDVDHIAASLVLAYGCAATVVSISHHTLLFLAPKTLLP
jgi:hypothetical protein